MKKTDVKIIKKEFPSIEPIFYVKVRHPWFKNWMYIAKYTDRFYFTTLNYKVTFNSIEEVYNKLYEYKKIKKRTVKEMVNSESRIIKEGNLELDF